MIPTVTDKASGERQAGGPNMLACCLLECPESTPVAPSSEPKHDSDSVRHVPELRRRERIVKSAWRNHWMLVSSCWSAGGVAPLPPALSGSKLPVAVIKFFKGSRAWCPL